MPKECIEMAKIRDSHLIELVRSNPILYDTEHEFYMDNQRKMNIWQQISAELDVEAPLCKTRWNNLRDNFRKSLRKENRNKKRYKYFKQLSFLRKFFKKTDDMEFRTGPDQSDEENAEDTIHFEVDTFLEEGTVHEKSPSPFMSRPQRKKYKLNRSIKDEEAIDYYGQDSQPAAKMPRTYNRHKDNSIPDNLDYYANNTHPVDAFLAGIAPTLKSLTPYYLSMAKSEIFSTVHKYELKTIVEEQQPVNVLVSESLRDSTPTASDRCLKEEDPL